MRLTLLGSLLAFSIVSIPSSHAIDLGQCERTLAKLHSVGDVRLLSDCMDFYFGNEGYDEPVGSFNKVIRLGLRALEVEPGQAATYTAIAWLQYSKWATWKNEPMRMPDGEPQLANAVALLKSGRRYLGGDAGFLKDSGDTILPAAQYYDPSLYPFVIDCYESAEKLAQGAPLVRVRLDLGHIYRKLQNKELAIAWYRKVLEVDPANEVAHRYLRALGAESRFNPS